MEDTKQITAKNISALRVKNKMTQLELADLLNYSDKAVSKWERGDSLPDVITLKRMADLFGVTVDYLITEHSEDEKLPISKTVRNNHVVITLIAVFGVWLLGTCIFVFSGLFEHRLWYAYVVCVPISMLVLLVFNSIWGKKSANMYVISALMWSSILTVYLGFKLYTLYDLWMFFIIGIPSQIIIFLCFRIKGVGKIHYGVELLHRSGNEKVTDNDAESTSDTGNDTLEKSSDGE